VDLAPERARVSLERMEAVLGEPEAKPRSRPSPRPPADSRRDELPILPLATATPERSLSTSEMGALTRRRRGSGVFVFFSIFALGVLAAGLYTGTINMRALRGEIAGAASAVASAVGSGLPSATGAPTTSPAVPAATSTPSSVPNPATMATTSETPIPAPLASPVVPTPEPLVAMADASGVSAPAPSDEPDQPNLEEPLPPPAAPIASAATNVAHPALPAHPAPAPTKHHTKPKHSVKVHRHH
jgi:hypothetical protein